VDLGGNDAFNNGGRPDDVILKVSSETLPIRLLHVTFQGASFENIVSKYLDPPKVKDMKNNDDKNSIFMIKVNLNFFKTNVFIVRIALDI
jgi:hypothetical protein